MPSCPCFENCCKDVRNVDIGIASAAFVLECLRWGLTKARSTKKEGDTFAIDAGQLLIDTLLLILVVSKRCCLKKRRGRCRDIGLLDILITAAVVFLDGLKWILKIMRTMEKPEDFYIIDSYVLAIDIGVTLIELFTCCTC